LLYTFDVISGALEALNSGSPLRPEIYKMCLTNTVHLIDFDNLSPQQKKKLDAVHKKMKARRDSLQKRLDELDEGLAKLEGKQRGRAPKKAKR
jgi:hypothetical protein